MKKKSISISSRKAKGRGLQKWVAQKISEITGIPCGKDERIASREMGQSGTDIRLVGKAKEVFPFSIECKYQETWSVPAWIQQAKDNWGKGTDWLLFMRKNRHEEIVVLDAEAFFKIYEEYLKLKELEEKTCEARKRSN
jgi:hypothetical protein